MTKYTDIFIGSAALGAALSNFVMLVIMDVNPVRANFIILTILSILASTRLIREGFSK